MLLRFSVANFLSYNKKQTLYLEPVLRYKKHKENKERYFEKGKTKALKSILLYGANASGKSNLLKALDFMQNKVLTSEFEKVLHEKIPYDKKNKYMFCDDTINKPSFFEIDLYTDGKTYTYGFEIHNGKIVSEWLEKNNKTIFIRENDEIKIPDKIFKKNVSSLLEFVREDVLAINTLSKFNIQDAMDITSFFNNMSIIIKRNSILDEVLMKGEINLSLSNEKLKKHFLELLSKFGFKFNSIDVKETNKAVPDFETVYLLNGKQIKMELTQESEGTQKILPILASLVNLMEVGGGVLVVDELDTQIHPLLLVKLINYINSNQNANIQFIATTHDTNLLKRSNIDRDQIYFTERNEDMSTQLYSLVEFKVRKEHDIEKNYLTGKYGGIPYINDIL